MSGPARRNRFRSVRRRFLRAAALVVPAAAVFTFAPAAPPDIGNPQAAVPPRPPVRSPEQVMERTISQLNATLESHPGRASAVILDTQGEVVYESRAHKRYELASVAKIYILAAYLDLIEREDRDANELERTMMTVMIEESDNRSASDLWSQLGEAEGLQTFLASRGLDAIDAPEVTDEWGEMRASAADLAELLSALYNGMLLNPQHTQFALDLLGNITEDQAWGVGSVREATETYVKNGWYPEEWGWTVNSAGIVSAPDASYVIVVLSESQPSLEEGVELIEDALNIFRDGALKHGPGELARPTTDPDPPAQGGPGDSP